MSIDPEIVFFSEDRIVLKELFAYEKIADFYPLHEKHLLSPAQISNAIDKILFLEIATYENNILSLNPAGRKFIIKNRNKIFNDKMNTYWKRPFQYLKIVSSMKRSETPHKIRMHHLDKNYFQIPQNRKDKSIEE